MYDGDQNRALILCDSRCNLRNDAQKGNRTAILSLISEPPRVILSSKMIMMS